jgi:septal ring factor EnvC (AmiA/AmiB activator)
VEELPEPLKEAVDAARDKSFTRRVALTTAVYAVVLALTSLGGSNATKEMLLAQQQASDQWAFYQAKVIREHQYRIQALRLEAELLERGGAMPAAARARYEELRRAFAEDEKRYNTEKKDIEKEARRLEHERDVNKARDPNFDFAEALLQIAIVVASVSILSTSRALFGVSVVFALVGALLCVNGYVLLDYRLLGRAILPG